MIVAAKKRGLMGLFTPVATPAAIGTCSSGWYWLNPACWEYSHDAWIQMSQFQQPPVPTSDITASQAATQTFFDNQSSDVGGPPDPTPCTSTIITSPIAVCDWIIYLGGVILVAPLAISLLESRR